MIKLISIFAVNDIINSKLHANRLNLYSIKQLENVYIYEKEKVLILDRKISKLYNVKKFNYSIDFNMNCQYLEEMRFHRAKPQKDRLISIIVIFLRTKYMIEYYLTKIEEKNKI